jgi:hypothetical protein
MPGQESQGQPFPLGPAPVVDPVDLGPVITPAPRGEAAGQLWDGLVMIARTDGFFELKRSRDCKPSFD